MDQIPDGTIVEFTYDSQGPCVFNLSWHDGFSIGRGKILKMPFSSGESYTVKIMGPEKIKRMIKGMVLSFQREAMRVVGLNVTLTAPIHPSKPIRPEDAELQRQMKFFAKRHDENFGSCPICGSGLKPLARTTFCPKCEG